MTEIDTIEHAERVGVIGTEIPSTLKRSDYAVDLDAPLVVRAYMVVYTVNKHFFHLISNAEGTKFWGGDWDARRPIGLTARSIEMVKAAIAQAPEVPD